MDVHAPYAPLHTWKDFWIHLGTITVGLLIAIGLEQSAEWIHHVHERHVLERDLMEEARKNDVLIRQDYQYDHTKRAWLGQMIPQVAAARADNGATKVHFLVPSGAGSVYWADTPVWSTGKESGEVALLPNEEGRMFNLVYVQQEELSTNVHRFFEVYGRQLSFEGRFDELTSHTGPDLTKMDAQDLREYQALLNDTLLQLRAMDSSVHSADAATTAVLNGAKSDVDVLAAMNAPLPAVANK